MNLTQSNKSHEEVWKKLCSNERKIHYEYSVQDNDGKLLGWLSSCTGKISFDSSVSVMRTFSGEAKKNELLDINLIDERIMPWMCVTFENGEVLKYPLGKFIISPSFKDDSPEQLVDIIGYDLGKIALDDKIVSRTVKSSEGYYSNELQEMLESLYQSYEVISSDKKRSNASEWDPGTSKLKIINDTLTSLNYYPLHFDEHGIPKAIPYVFPEDCSVEAYYKVDKDSIMLPGTALTSNRFEIPNKFVRYVENVDGTYLTSSYTNDSENNIFSTVSRGRTIVDIASVSDMASQEELDGYVKRCAIAAMTVNEKIQFKTLNMPGHGYKNCLFVENGSMGILGKYIETSWEMDLRLGGEMVHTCIKAVTV